MLSLLLATAVQEGALDVLDGETLYEDGWLFTLGYERVEKSTLLDGRDRESDPLDRRRIDDAAVLSAHYGLRHDLQLSLIAPWVRRALELDDPAGPDRYASSGLGDVTVAAKWRIQRWDGPGFATNLAILGGLELPTGSDDERDRGARLAPDLQPGSGSWDPFLGAGITHEPGRWRFNAFGLYKRQGMGGHDFKHGDQAFFELAAGNRFWLEPYPGPFMRLDALLRYRHEWKDVDGGNAVGDSGGDQLTAGVNWAFRPRPTLDVQVSLEVPVYESVEGIQLAEDWSFFFAIGVRI